MAPTTGEPKDTTGPEPIGHMPMIILLTTCTLCLIFILWRRADALRKIVSHRLKTFRQTEGPIRLSTDDGPPANEFLEDDYDDDNEHLNDSDDEPLSEHIRKATQAWREPDPSAQSSGEIRNLPSWPTS
ncbi:hypothetical protein BDN70DRAFT_850209 [Pholiota conissans]|uniref:Uncharacterized protein n=1 Tax=Pholiota conissans TaxID=109636 RepID=A0A9P5ZBK4_9AGAR|nr:hypothetical protein BDN70DRAFT_850209 [Pholiota conissans]